MSEEDVKAYAWAVTIYWCKDQLHSAARFSLGLLFDPEDGHHFFLILLQHAPLQ
jgi:hypothetical protein